CCVRAPLSPLPNRFCAIRSCASSGGSCLSRMCSDFWFGLAGSWATPSCGATANAPSCATVASKLIPDLSLCVPKNKDPSVVRTGVSKNLSLLFGWAASGEHFHLLYVEGRRRSRGRRRTGFLRARQLDRMAHMVSQFGGITGELIGLARSISQRESAGRAGNAALNILRSAIGCRWRRRSLRCVGLLARATGVLLRIVGNSRRCAVALRNHPCG